MATTSPPPYEENKITATTPPVALRQIVFHPILTTAQKIQYMIKNMLFIFTYTLVISISLALGKILSILLENENRKTQLSYALINLFVLIVITVIVCWSLNAEVQL